MRAGRGARGTFAVAAVCAATLAISACGGDGSDSPEPSPEQSAEIQALTELGDELTAAVASLDSEKLCAHLDPKVLDAQFKSRAQCAKVLKTSIANAEEKPSFEFTKVTIDGDRAVGETDSGEREHHFRKIDGKWYFTTDPEPDSGSDSSSGAQ